jgi:hypothetical protein
VKVLCRVFGHRKTIVVDPARPLDITLGCPRCKDPHTFRTLVRAHEDPNRPGWVGLEGVDRLRGYLEGLT